MLVCLSDLFSFAFMDYVILVVLVLKEGVLRFNSKLPGVVSK